jgi:uncharacterized heparinase superfamily protein
MWLGAFLSAAATFYIKSVEQEPKKRIAVFVRMENPTMANITLTRPTTIISFPGEIHAIDPARAVEIRTYVDKGRQKVSVDKSPR